MFSVPLRAITAGLSPAGPRARLSALIFHRVLAAPDEMRPTEPTEDDFARILKWVTQQFRVLSLADAVRGIMQRNLPARALVITFDDGYADNAQLASPILKRANLPATFFVTSGTLDGGRMFIDTLIAAAGNSRRATLDLTELGLSQYPLDSIAARRRAVDALIPIVKGIDGPERDRTADRIAQIAGAEPPKDLMMTGSHVRQLADDGFEIGGHTETHPVLARLSTEQATREIEGGRRRLHEITGKPVRFFAYPNGRPGLDYNARTVEIVRRLGFDAALTTACGVADSTSDLMQLPRFTPWDRRELRFGLRMIQNLTSGGRETDETPEHRHEVPLSP